MDNVLNEDSCSFSHDEVVQGDMHGGQRPKGRSSSLAPNSKAKTDEREATFSKTGQEGSFTDKTSKIPCRHKIVKIRHVDSGISPYVITTSLRPDAYMAKNADSDMLRLRTSPTKSQRKVGVYTFGCVSQDSCPRKSTLREKGKLGSKHAVKFSKGTWPVYKNSGKKGSFAVNYPKE